MSFNETLMNAEELEIDREWQERARDLDKNLPVEFASMESIIAEQNAEGAHNGNGVEPVSIRDRRAATDPSPARQRFVPIPPHQRSAPALAPTTKKKDPQRREYHVTKQSEPVDLFLEFVGSDGRLRTEQVTVQVRRIPSTEIPYIDRYELQLQRLRHQLADIKLDGPKSEIKLNRVAGEYNQTMKDMICFAVDMPEGTYEELDAAALTYLQGVMQEVASPKRSDEDDEGN